MIVVPIRVDSTKRIEEHSRRDGDGAPGVFCGGRHCCAGLFKSSIRDDVRFAATKGANAPEQCIRCPIAYDSSVTKLDVYAFECMHGAEAAVIRYPWIGFDFRIGRRHEIEDVVIVVLMVKTALIDTILKIPFECFRVCRNKPCVRSAVARDRLDRKHRTAIAEAHGGRLEGWRFKAEARLRGCKVDTRFRIGRHAAEGEKRNDVFSDPVSMRIKMPTCARFPRRPQDAFTGRTNIVIEIVHLENRPQNINHRLECDHGGFRAIFPLLRALCGVDQPAFGQIRG